VKLQGRTAIITGSSRGIGRAIAIEFAREGCNIMINYASNEQAARETEEEIKKFGVRTYLCKADISKHEEAKSMVDQAINFFGKVDILVNNAGIASPALLAKMSQEQWRNVLDVDLSGAFNCAHAIINHMIANSYGRIINISSVYGQTGAFGQCNYAAAKWGVIGLTKSLALEVGRHNILVNAIAPGAVETDLIKSVREDFMQRYVEANPLHRIAKPEEVAKAALFLATDATYTTGAVIPVNGGHHV
jgi:NAD(P)-dependent dehydrogenase (short-subunit alcohol dehydrogenase family)